MGTDSYFNLCILTSWLQYHPDVSKDSRADEVFKNIRLAYDVSDATILFFNSLISASVKEILTKYSCWLVALYFMPSICVFHAKYKFGSSKGNLWVSEVSVVRWIIFSGCYKFCICHKWNLSCLLRAYPMEWFCPCQSRIWRQLFFADGLLFSIPIIAMPKLAWNL